MNAVGRALAPLLAAAARLISGAGVRWRGCAPDTRPCVYFANHTSHFDFVVLWSALPREARRRTRPVAARDYWEAGPLRRLLARDVFNAVLVDRRREEGSQHDAIEDLSCALAGGSSLILFPEGTRGQGAEPARFRSGLFNLAARNPGLELVPVYLGNLHRVLPKGEFFPVPLNSSVSFGPPIQLAEHESREAFLGRARAAVMELSRT